MSEVILGNELTSLACNLEDGSWRLIGLPIKRLFFEWDTGLMLSSFNSGVYLLEDTNIQPLVDGIDPVSFQLQTPQFLADVAQKGTLSMVFIEANTRGEQLTVRVIVDEDGEADANMVTIGIIQTPVRQTVELPINGPPIQGRRFAVRLVGNLSQRVDIFGVELDIEVPDPVRQ